MSGLVGLDKMPSRVVLGMVQLPLPNIVDPKAGDPT